MPTIEKRPQQTMQFANGPQVTKQPPGETPQKQTARPADAPPKRPILYPSANDPTDET